MTGADKTAAADDVAAVVVADKMRWYSGNSLGLGRRAVVGHTGLMDSIAAVVEAEAAAASAFVPTC